jgi:sarcosine oxidase subunit gamma
VARLLARSPAEGLLPAEAGGVTLTEAHPEAITSVAPHRGRAREVSDHLMAAVGVDFPKPGHATGGDEVRAVWSGPGQALVLGPAVSVAGAALTDQSDAWAVLHLEGPRAEDVLARLVPVDLRRSAFRQGHTARTLLGHMTCSVTRIGAERFEILVFRSMAKTAVHELTRAMGHVAARG